MNVELANGVAMPRLGLGVYQIGRGDPTRRAVRWALQAGYRLIDTAALYGNEREVGEAIGESGLSRSDVFVTTKLWNSDHGYRATLRAFQQSLARLGLEYVDLYLIHWPVPELRAESWRAMEELYDSGLCRAIGVSNYTIAHLQQVLDSARHRPVVNQVELSPFLTQPDLRSFCQAHHIHVQAYSPLAKGRRMDHRLLRRLAATYNRAPAQLMLRWALQHGLSVIPKSSRYERIEQNAQVFDFELAEKDMALLDDLNEELRLAWDPTTVP